MTKIIATLFSHSTAEDARAYFNGSFQQVDVRKSSVLPDGTYRVVDGVLCQVVAGVPPELSPQAETSEETRRER